MLGHLSRPIEDYFPEIETIADGPASAYVRVSISIFDHWLTEAEASESRITCYSQAVELNALDEYIDGEQRLMNFYHSVSEGGVVCNRPGPRRLISAHDPQLSDIFRSSLREQRFMDVYFVSGRVRVVGGYDRTDTAFLESENELQSLREHAKKTGVFLL